MAGSRQAHNAATLVGGGLLKKILYSGQSEAFVFNVMFHQFYRLALLFFSPVLLFAEEDLEAYLRTFEGRWVGHFTIHSAATGYSETFPVEQQYWWKDGQLQGVAVSERKSGMESARSSTYIKDGKLISVMKRGSEEEPFIGLFHEGGILWLPANMDRAKDYQIKEFIVVEDGKRILKTEGFDSYVYQDGLAHIVYRGELESKE
jgi:hypothetical protein